MAESGEASPTGAAIPPLGLRRLTRTLLEGGDSALGERWIPCLLSSNGCIGASMVDAATVGYTAVIQENYG